MCDQTTIDYLDGDVVWVKLGSCWWPGEVVGPEKLPPDVLPSFRKPPIAVVKFFQEDTYEYVKNINAIYKYNCSRKNEFINKGLYMYRTKHGHMEKFPEDIIRAETAVGGDKEILTRDEFQEKKKESYAGIFGDTPKRTPGPSPGKKGRGGKGRLSAESPKLSTPIRKLYKEKSDYKVHILLQGSKEPQRQSTESISTPSTSRAGSEPLEDKPQKVAEPAVTISTPTISTPTVSTPTVSSAGIYACHSCSFSTSRLNVLILHNKTHSVTYTPYIPSPICKKPAAKPSPKSTPKTSRTPKTPKMPRPRKEKTEKPKKISHPKKRSAEGKANYFEVKKPKTEQEIKSSLLADWDDADEDSNDESSAIVMSGSPEVPVGAESPAVPTPAELPITQVEPVELSSPIGKNSDDLTSSEKPESSSDSKYEFCEDEDWHVEADAGRKIPRVKNPSKRKEETKSLSIDEDEVAKEVAELLTETKVPELPSIPKLLKVEENFPEPPVVKSPDKNPDIVSKQKSPEKAPEAKPIKAIFKTKTFFRSRHSRSQDVIGKYVAEQLNAAERMDLSESDINGSEAVSSPEETRQSSPREHPKVARLAPKIQLKKQIREKERINFDLPVEDSTITKATDTKLENLPTEKLELALETENPETPVTKSLQDVLYPTQEIKPINKELPDKLLHKEDNRGFDDEIFEKIDNGIDKKSNMTSETVKDSGRNKENLKQTLTDSSPKKSKVQSVLEAVKETTSQQSDENQQELSLPSENISDNDLQESNEQPKEVSSPVEMLHEERQKNLEEYEQSTEITPIKKFYRSPQKLINQQSDISTETVHKISPQKLSSEQIEHLQKECHISPQILHDNQSLISSDNLHISPQKLCVMQGVVTSENSHKSSPKKLCDKTSEISPEKSSISPQKLCDKQSVILAEETSPHKSYDEHTEYSHEKFYISPQKLHEKQDALVPEKYESPKKSCEKESEISPEKIHKTSIQNSGEQQIVALKTFHKLSPHKTFDQQSEVVSEKFFKTTPLTQQSEISDYLQIDSKKHIEKSLETSTLKKPIETSPLKSNDHLKEISSSPAKFHEPVVQKSYEQLIQPYMSDSTASAVDALLSVSRETDRVPRIVSDDPPEDLFEDDNKEIATNNDVAINDDINTNNEIYEEQDVVQEEVNVDENDFNVITDQEVSHDDVNQSLLPQDSAAFVPKDVGTCEDVITETVIDNIPSESDLQVAEALINLPSTAIQNKTTHCDSLESVNVPMCLENEEFVEEVIAANETVIDEGETKENETDNVVELPPESLLSHSDNLNVRYETEQEKSENLNAAQSLVQMSESIDHQMNLVETKDNNNKGVKGKQNNGIDSNSTIEQKLALLSSENNSDLVGGKSPKFETTSSKLLKILEEPSILKSSVKTTPVKHIILPGQEKILNIDVAKSPLKGKPPPKQKIIIRRAPPNKNIINSFSEVVSSPDNIILSRNNTDGSSIQTFTIQASTEPHIPTDAKQFIIQPKIRKITKPSKLQKIKPQNSLITQLKETKTLNDTNASDEPIFDINSMPVVLSDDLLTPENIEKMPIVMSDGNLITNTSSTPNPPKLVKSKPTIIENEKVTISPVPSKPEVKTLVMNTASDVNKVTTPNILSKSSKLRGGKPMLVIDKATGKQKIIMTKAEPVIKEIKQTPSLIQTAPQSVTKTEKFIILPTTNSPRAGRTQKIVIDPQTGKAHVLVAKGQDTSLSAPDNKPVSAKLIPSSSNASTPGNTVMIITNAQGAQSRIVLTPEHEKILFPNKQQPNVSQLKTITHRISTTTGVVQKTVVTASPAKTQTRIVPKQQKSAIITSKGQLIVGGRVATTAQNIAPMPEIRPAPPRRIIASEPKKLVQAIQKNTSEPLIFLQQKSGAVMQLTAAQFEHLQRTGQIVQKPVPVQENKIVVQKSVTISPKDTIIPTIQRHRVRKTVTESTTPAKKVKQEIAIAPAPVVSAPVPPLTSLSSPAPAPTISISTIVPSVSNTVSIATTPNYPNLENFEELLPSTAIVRPTEPPATPIARPIEPAPVVRLPEPVTAPVVRLPQPVAAPVVRLPEPVSPPPEPVPEPPPTQLSDGQLLALPGETFGGPPGSFYLCVEDSGTFTAIDNRPLLLENNQLVPMTIEPAPVFAPQPERRDILEAALANSDVFHADTPRDDGPDFRDLNANVSVHCRVSETSTTLNQPPIMTPVEIPSKVDTEPAVATNLEDGLAVIGVTSHTVPTSLELPITVTDPRIALKATNPLSNNNYGTTLLPSPNTEMSFVSTEEVEVPVGPISMPLLTDEEAVGKSMPILTDEVAERTVSSVDSAVGSPSSLDVRESEPEEGGGGWTRRLLTPGSDTSEASAEIPLQPAIQLSVNELSRHS